MTESTLLVRRVAKRKEPRWATRAGSMYSCSRPFLEEQRHLPDSFMREAVTEMHGGYTSGALSSRRSCCTFDSTI
jgi:hypothetical protein